jgi:MFS family permease
MDPYLTRHEVPPTPAGSWWRGRWFLRLLAVRTTGQGSDGVFQVALASYALFSDDQATAAELAVATAVVLLPWSLLGPYAGVLLDHWPRRQVLVLGNLLRALVVLLLAGAVLAEASSAVVYGAALVALGVNRFLLAGLSAALPHTVPLRSLTEANAVTPTVGTAAFVGGLGLATLLRGGLVLPAQGDHGLLAVAAAGYLAAGGLALLMPSRLLGPDGPPERRPRLVHLLAGLVDGVHHLRSRPWPAAALTSLAAMRLWFGLVIVSAVLTLRNAADDDAEAITALGGFTVATGAGFLSAALAAPLLARRLGRGRAMVVALALTGAAPLPAALVDAPAGWWVSGALLGLGAQTTKICVDAVVQAGIDDTARGRVFALYDMAFNIAFVLAAALAVVLLPASGRSVPVLLACSLGLVLTAGGFARIIARHPAPPEVSGLR